jgi:hypothetical protein
VRYAACLFLPAHFTPLWTRPADTPSSGSYWFAFHASKLLVASGPRAPRFPGCGTVMLCLSRPPTLTASALSRGLHFV